MALALQNRNMAGPQCGTVFESLIAHPMTLAHASTRAAARLPDRLNDLQLRRVPRACTAAALLALALVTACSKDTTPPAAPPAGAAAQVGVVVMQPQSQTLSSTLPGRTSAIRRAEVRPQVSGIVQTRLFTEGAMVQKGQPLYQIEPATLRATEASAAAVLAKAQATLQTQQANAKRNAQLVQIQAISQQAYDESAASLKQAAADVEVARANLEMARIQLQYARITAPIEGRISLSQVSPGALVTANQSTALTEIVQMHPMYVDFTQSTAELLQLKNDWAAGRYQQLGTDQIPLEIQLEDGSAYPHVAKLKFSGLIVNSTMGTVTLRAEVPNPDGVLLPGMFVQAKLPTGVAADALLVPQRSVSRDLTGRASVLVVNADNKVEKRTVELSRAMGAHWLLDSGLQAGERVVVDGFQRIKPGDTVAAVTVQEAANPEAKAVDLQAAAASLRAAAPAK